MSITTQPILIGDLLVRAGMATHKSVADAVPISLKTGLPIGRVLIGTGSMTEGELQQALLAQSLIRDSLLSFDLAVQALRIVVREGFNLEQALNIVGWSAQSFSDENRLGQLLLQADIVTREQVEEAMSVFYTTGLPLARAMVVKGFISNLVAYVALSSQQLLRDKKISREQMVQSLQAAKHSRAVIEDDAVQGYLRLNAPNTIRLGELFVCANMVTEEGLVACVELMLRTGATLGETLLQKGLVDEPGLNRALETQRLVTEGILEVEKAPDVLRKAHYERLSVKKALAQFAPGRLLSQPEPQAAGVKIVQMAPPPEGAEKVEDMSPERKRRTHEEWRARKLASKMLGKVEAINTRNQYLANVLNVDFNDREIEKLFATAKHDIENGCNFDGSMDAIDHLLTAVEHRAYQSGYLRCSLDSATISSELTEKVESLKKQLQEEMDKVDELQRQLKTAKSKPQKAASQAALSPHDALCSTSTSISSKAQTEKSIEALQDMLTSQKKEKPQTKTNPPAASKKRTKGKKSR